MAESFDNLHFERFPRNKNKTLKPWSAIEEHMLLHLADNNIELECPILIEDQYGFMTSQLYSGSPIVLLSYQSQKRGILHNLKLNGLTKEGVTFERVGDASERKGKLALMRIPKSLALFEYYLKQLTKQLDPSGRAVCGFMTKYFTKSMLDLAAKYFQSVDQTRAHKKSRLIILSNPIAASEQLENLDLIHEIEYNGSKYRQHYGVFSKGNIDIGTRFLLDNCPEISGSVLDLACGNGVIGLELAKSNKAINEVSFVDDFALAILSAKLNSKDPKHTFVWSDNLQDYAESSYDFVVTNPPFHFGHEIDINVSIGLFEQALRVLKPSGQLILVANKHLNYSTHLSKLYSLVSSYATNSKFEVITCKK